MIDTSGWEIKREKTAVDYVLDKKKINKRRGVKIPIGFINQIASRY